MNIFEAKTVVPMHIGTEGPPFDDPDWLFELKLDGERCLAYLDRKSTVLINRRGNKLGAKFPELSGLHQQAAQRCLLDGELVITVNGVPDFEQIKRRSFQSSKVAIDLAARRFPATFVAFDILYLDDRPIIDKPLTERKKLLAGVVEESEMLALARYIENQGRAFFGLVVERSLEGLIAKKKDSLYHPGRTTLDWVKIKYLLDDDFIICGYILKEGRHVASLVLGQYELARQNGGGDSTVIELSRRMAYKGHVTLGRAKDDFTIITASPEADHHPFPEEPPPADREAVWLKPDLVCKVRFTARTAAGKLRQPVYVGLRPDKTAQEAVEYLWRR